METVEPLLLLSAVVEGDCRLGTMLVEAAVGVSGTLFHLLSLSFSPIEPILILILGCTVDFSTTISQYVKSTAFPASRPRVFVGLLTEKQTPSRR
ncbi:hypothetical protein L2E82_18459 [Cichorium intybus]|uniref:Uncharacterized protein n=1 Tax=Cichorium intybus TaxID=13427 RepID=A0ACB9FAW2_CICIN|nr:hypothetical protein L2E82_18459 [Cichorium intybus]